MFSLKGDGLYLLCASLALARNAARLRALRRYARFIRAPPLFLKKSPNPQRAQGASLAVRVKFLYRKNHSFVFIYLVNLT